MKITRETLKRIIKEEYNALQREAEGETPVAEPEKLKEPKIEIGPEEEKSSTNRFGEPVKYKDRMITVLMPNGDKRIYLATRAGRKKNKKGEEVCNVYLKRTERADGEIIKHEMLIDEYVLFTETAIYSSIRGDLIRMLPPPKPPGPNASWASRGVYRDTMKIYNR